MVGVSNRPIEILPHPILTGTQSRTSSVCPGPIGSYSFIRVIFLKPINTHLLFPKEGNVLKYQTTKSKPSRRSQHPHFYPCSFSKTFNLLWNSLTLASKHHYCSLSLFKSCHCVSPTLCGNSPLLCYFDEWASSPQTWLTSNTTWKCRFNLVNWQFLFKYDTGTCKAGNSIVSW